jgi:sulfur relay (sulfurtransferase) DsrC/TusE family protein
MERWDVLVDFFEEEGHKKADGGFTSENIRRFVRQYYSQYRKTPAMVYALYEAFKEIYSKEVKDSYFRGVIEKAWTTSIDENNVQWVHLDKQKKLRLRKRKV